MRTLIAALKISLDGMAESSAGYAEWAESWSEDYGLTPQIDACLIGGGMYPGYASYWTGLRTAPDTPAWITGEPPTAGEREWVAAMARIPHYVLSRSIDTVDLPNTTLLRDPADVAALKERPGKDIYLMGGARIVARLMDAGLVDELRLITYPVLAPGGTPLFGTVTTPPKLELRSVERLDAGKVGLTYTVR